MVKLYKKEHGTSHQFTFGYFSFYLPSQMFASILFYTISVQCSVNFVLNPMFILKTFRLSRCGRKCLRKLGKHLLRKSRRKLNHFHKMTFVCCLKCYLCYSSSGLLSVLGTVRCCHDMRRVRRGCKVEPNIANLGLGGWKGEGEG
jgi:hypothetical protein